MKKFAAVLIISLASAGISFAGGGCSSSKSYTMANSSKALKGDVVLMAEGKRVIKHNGKLGQIFFTIQTDAGETLAQEIDKKIADLILDDDVLVKAHTEIEAGSQRIGNFADEITNGG